MWRLYLPHISAAAQLLLGALAWSVGGRRMPRDFVSDGTPYRIEFLDASQNICAVVDLSCANDNEAIVEAQKADIFANDGIIIRQGHRIVYRRRGS